MFKGCVCIKCVKPSKLHVQAVLNSMYVWNKYLHTLSEINDNTISISTAHRCGFELYSVDESSSMYI